MTDKPKTVAQLSAEAMIRQVQKHYPPEVLDELRRRAADVPKPDLGPEFTMTDEEIWEALERPRERR